MANTTEIGSKTTPSATYVVRNGRFYLEPDKFYAYAKEFKNARRFSTKEQARTCVNDNDSLISGRKVLEVTFGLRWHDGDGDLDGTYYSDGDRAFVSGPKKATRFATPALAHAAQDPSTFVGADGPGDLCGWKVVRFLKVVK